MDIITKIDRLIETTISGDVEKNLTKGHVTLLGMKYKKKKKKSKLTGVDIVIHEELFENYSLYNLTDDNIKLLEISAFANLNESDFNELYEAFDFKDISSKFKRIFKKSGLHISKSDGLIQMILKSGKHIGKVIWYAMKAAVGNEEDKQKLIQIIKETKISSSQLIDFLLKLDMLTLHAITGPIHMIDAVTGWHLWANLGKIGTETKHIFNKAINDLETI